MNNKIDDKLEFLKLEQNDVQKDIDEQEREKYIYTTRLESISYKLSNLKYLYDMYDKEIKEIEKKIRENK